LNTKRGADPDDSKVWCWSAMTEYRIDSANEKGMCGQDWVSKLPKRSSALQRRSTMSERSHPWPRRVFREPSK